MCDKHTEKDCLPLLEDWRQQKGVSVFSIEPGDEHKNIQTLSSIWQFLSEQKATRQALLINLGGGVVTDIGGFAAATFKRGIHYINLPTSILGAVDAAVGGKTAINFNGLKNEVGAFYPPQAVVLHAPFFKTLDQPNILSGYAEMLKHGLLADSAYFNRLLQLDLEKPDDKAFIDAIKRSIEIKPGIIEQDPLEKGLRKALNLGHTTAHAFESLALKRHQPILHGYAVAWGLIGELYLSVKLLHFPNDILQQLVSLVKESYGVFFICCQDYPFLLEAMSHDKKNDNTHVRFTLLEEIGKPTLDMIVEPAWMEEMLDFYQDSMGF